MTLTGLCSMRVGVRFASKVSGVARDGAISGRVFMMPPTGRGEVFGKMTAAPLGAIGRPPPPSISFIMNGVDGLLRRSGYKNCLTMNVPFDQSVYLCNWQGNDSAALRRIR